MLDTKKKMIIIIFEGYIFLCLPPNNSNYWYRQFEIKPEDLEFTRFDCIIELIKTSFEKEIKCEAVPSIYPFFTPSCVKSIIH